MPQRNLYWEHEGNAAIRQGDMKLVREGLRGKWELFDLSADRTEQHDLSSTQVGLAADLKSQWRQWATASNVLPKPQPKKKASGKKTKAK
ncbi:MAG: hypothetical protein AAF664_24990 [Planctomycetota bacterium]